MNLYQIKIPANGFKVYNIRANGIKDAVGQAQACLQNGKDSDTCVDLDSKQKPTFDINMLSWDIDILHKNFK